MPVPPKQLIASLLFVFAACGHNDPHPIVVTPSTEAATDARFTVHGRILDSHIRDVREFEAAVNVNRVREAAWVIAVADSQVRAGQGAAIRPPAATVTSVTAVMQCIKDHESGNYTEHSHPNSGSGAYQYVPGTWRTWAARAGYMGYDLAYQAPPWVQDAVTAFTLTHGGAGNWSTRWGNDPCTGA